MALTSNITTLYTPDQPRVLSARYAMDAEDRRYVDEQALGAQRHLTESLIRGQIGSNFLLAQSSAALEPGDLFCVASEAATERPGSLALRKVQKATPAALAATGVVLGIATAAATPGNWVHGAMEGIVGSALTGLLPGAEGYVRASSTGRCERVDSLGTGDFPLGYVDGYGNLSLLRERSVSASGGGGSGGYTTIQNAGFAMPQRTTVNFIGFTVADSGGITRVTNTLLPGSATGQTLVWNGTAWAAGALDLADADARTGVLPAANGGTGIAGAGGVANRVLVTADGTSWSAGQVSLSTMVTGQLPVTNLANGSAASVLGRAAGTSGAYADIVSTADGQVLTRAGGVLTWGAALGEYRTVATIAARNAIPAGLRTNGMLAYVQALKVVYKLAPDLATWNFYDASPELSLQTAWYVDPTGNDNNDGSLGAPLLTPGELHNRLCPRGSPCILTNDVGVYLNTISNAAVTYYDFSLSVTTTNQALTIPPLPSPVGRWTLTVFCGKTSSAPITLSAVTTPVGATSTRGALATTAGTFVAGERIRMTSGSANGAVACSSGLNGSAQSTFHFPFSIPTVLGSLLYTDATHTTPAPGDTCVVDTLVTTIQTATLDASGLALIEVRDARLFQVSINGTGIRGRYTGTGGNVYLCTCDQVSATGRWSNNTDGAFALACRTISTSNTALIGTGWCLVEHVVQGVLGLSGSATTYGINFDGSAGSGSGRWIVGIGNDFNHPGEAQPSSVRLTTALYGGTSGALEAENGAGGSSSLLNSVIYVSSGSQVLVDSADGYLWGASANFGFGFTVCDNAYVLAAPAVVSNFTSVFKIPSNTNVRMAGYSLTWADLPFVRADRGCGFTTGNPDASFEEGYLKLTGQTGNIGSTQVIQTPYPGRYMFSTHGEVTVPGTSGTITVTAAWTDRLGVARTANLVTSGSITSAGGFGGGPLTFETNGAPITFTTTGIVTAGALSYILEVGCRRLTAFPGFYSNAPVGTAAGQTQIWNGSSWVAGALDLADTDAVTGILPAANGGTGIGGAGGAANRVLTTTNGSTWTAALVALTTMVTGLLPFGNLADGAATSVLGRSANTAGVQASIAATTDGQVLRRAGGVLGFGAVDLSDTDAVTGQLPFGNLTDGSATSVLARAGGTAGAMASLAATADGQFLQRAGGALTWSSLAPASIGGGTAVGQVLVNATGNIPTWGAVDLADTDAVTGRLPFGNLADGLALSVLGRSASTSGVMASITGTADQVLRVNGAGTSVGFGSIATAGITDGAVTLAKLANANASSVLGRSAATNGVYADILSSADGQVLRRGASGVVGFGAVDLADTDAVTGLLPFANLANGSATSVFGRSAGSAGVMASIAATADGQVLQRVSGALVFAAAGVGSLAGGTAVGQVLTNAVGNVPTWGAVDLADTDAVTGLLPFANVANGSALSVLGRSAATAGVMASIAGAADQVLLVNTAGTSLAFGTVATGGITNGAVTLAKLASATASSVLGRSAASAGGYADITSSADGQVLRRGAAGVVAFGAVDLADTDAVTGLLPFANIANVAGLSVLGRDLNSSGTMVEITAGAADLILRVNPAGTGIAFGTISGNGIASNTIPVSKLLNATASSVLGRSPASSGAYADIVSTADGQVLRRGASGVIDFGAVDLADADAVTGLLPHSNIANGNATSVFGRDLGTAGPQGSITATADGQVLRRVSGGLGFGPINLASGQAVSGLLPLANLTGGTAVGQVLLNTTGNVPSWGAVDLADADAVTGLLPLGNIAPAGSNGRVMVTVGGVPTWGTALGNNSDDFSITASGTFSAAVGVTGNFLVATSSAVALAVSGSTILHLADLSGRRILGLFGGVTTTEMPANTGSLVVRLAHATSRPTTGLPTGGSLLWSDSTLGLSYKSEFGVETTLGSNCAALASKRRIVDWKSPIEEVTTSSTSVVTVTSFVATNINGVAFTNGLLVVRAKCWSFGISNYPSYCERVATIRVTSGALTLVDDRPGFDSLLGNGVQGNGINTPSITTSGGSVIFRAAPFFASQKLIAYFEVHGSED